MKTLLLILSLYAGCNMNNQESPVNEVVTTSSRDTIKKIIKSEDEWKKELNPMEYKVIRQKGTEQAFTGDLWDHHEKGTYICRACQLPLFSSETKFESGTG